MTRHSDKDFDRMLDEVLDQIREDTPGDEVVEAAADRVWARLSDQARADEIVSSDACVDYRRMIPEFIDGSLAEARVVLLEDHVRECLPCRRALKIAREGEVARPAVVAGDAERTASRKPWGVLLAAAAAVLLAVVMVPAILGPAPGFVEVADLDGGLYHITETGTAPVEAGAKLELAAGESLRAAKGAHALLTLADGSQVEMRERSEVGLTRDRTLAGIVKRDNTVRLARGSIIVEASEQGSGHLWVDTEECQVSVTGTVFSVNHGTKGSRVSVIEGEVRVQYGDFDEFLTPGDQVSTDPHLGYIPVAQEIAWSRNLDQHLALLEEFKKLGQAIDEAIELPGLRYSTRLLDQAPAGTVMYAAFPNVGGTLGDAYDVVKEKVRDNALLNDWWTRNVVEPGAEPMVEMAVEKIRDFSEQLGPEIVLTMQADETGEPRAPLIFAQLQNPGGFREFVEAQIAELKEMAGAEDHPDGILFIDSVLQATPRQDTLFVYLKDGVMFASPEADVIQRAEGVSFEGSSFHDRLAQSYREGVEWLFAVDLERIIGSGVDAADDPNSTQMLRDLGILDVKHLIAERRDFGDHAEHRAIVSFDQPRHGVVAWLADPAPMGALDFISADASVAAAFVTKDPRSMLDELFSFIPDESFAADLAQFESEFGISIRDDLAGPLGGEIAVALDGPVLPKPSWKLVLEVYDAPRLQRTLEWAIEQVNRETAAHEDGHGYKAAIVEHVMGGRTYYALTLNGEEIGVHYTFVDGYMVAAASRPLIDQALQTRQLGTTLRKSAEFRALLPQDGRVNFSAIAYQNLGPVLGPLAEMAASAGESLTPEQSAIVDRLAAGQPPSLVFAYGEPERITLVANTEGGLFGSGFGSLFNLSALDTLERLGNQIEP
jgi:ferric-dicitrate binding protein FerR (iron transport regulator)